LMGVPIGGMIVLMQMEMEMAMIREGREETLAEEEVVAAAEEQVEEMIKEEGEELAEGMIKEEVEELVKDMIRDEVEVEELVETTFKMMMIMTTIILLAELLQAEAEEEVEAVEEKKITMLVEAPNPKAVVEAKKSRLSNTTSLLFKTISPQTSKALPPTSQLVHNARVILFV
jgi:hypothetical protein